MATRQRKKRPRILVVTPEITYLPNNMGNMANYLKAKAGGLADVSASLVSVLFELGADIHVALPHYRQMFHVRIGSFLSEELRIYKAKLPQDRIHLAEDRVFYYRDHVYGDHAGENPKLALAFQREVINNIIPHVRPDLIHCNDWMTGLIPAMARRLQIPCLMTLHNIHSLEITLAEIEDHGIDAAEFWQHLYYQRVPHSYEESRGGNPVDFLLSGIFASHYINTVSPTFLREIVYGQHDFIDPKVRQEVTAKWQSGCAVGILNAPSPSYNPENDGALARCYDAATVSDGKRTNKNFLQEHVGLKRAPDAPLFFWPSRLDPIQKGCQLLAHILHDVVQDHQREGLQLIFVANGPFLQHIQDIVRMHGFYDRVAVCPFDEKLSRLAYAAADFVLIPSMFEPCGLPQMIGPKYGTLPVAHDTGGLRDTVQELNPAAQSGNGFLFKNYDSNGLRWAIDEAVRFHHLPAETRTSNIRRIMKKAFESFTHAVNAQRYIDLYERMLERPLIP